MALTAASTIEQRVGQAGYRLCGDPAGPDLEVTLWGDWTAAASDALAVDFVKLLCAMKAAGAVHGCFRTLVDIRDKRSKREDAVADFRRFFHNGSPSRRIAILLRPDVVDRDALALLGPPDRVAVFDDPVLARHWLAATPAALPASVSMDGYDERKAARR